MRKLHVAGVVIMLLWLAALGWLVWRQRHAEVGAAYPTQPRVPA